MNIKLYQFFKYFLSFNWYPGLPDERPFRIFVLIYIPVCVIVIGLQLFVIWQLLHQRGLIP